MTPSSQSRACFRESQRRPSAAANPEGVSGPDSVVCQHRGNYNVLHEKLQPFHGMLHPAINCSSIVVTGRPETSLTAVAQARVAWPSTCTVQAPHSATPQPYFVPVSPNSSRRYQSSGIDGSPSKDCVCPLTCNLTIWPPPISVRMHPSWSPQHRCTKRDCGRPFLMKDR